MGSRKCRVSLKDLVILHIEVVPVPIEGIWISRVLYDDLDFRDVQGHDRISHGVSDLMASQALNDELFQPPWASPRSCSNESPLLSPLQPQSRRPGAQSAERKNNRQSSKLPTGKAPQATNNEMQRSGPGGRVSNLGSQCLLAPTVLA